MSFYMLLRRRSLRSLRTACCRRVHLEPELHQLGDEHLRVLRVRDVARLLEDPQPAPARRVQDILEQLLLGRARLRLDGPGEDFLE